jgi:excisionase family DNA binding protein
MELIDLKTLSTQTSLSICTLRRYIQNFGMPCYRVGRKILVDPDEFEEWLTQFKTTSQPKDHDIKKLVHNTLTKLGLPSS